MMKRIRIVVTAIMAATIVIFSALTVFSYLALPHIISPETNNAFRNYVNETDPTGMGVFNSSILGSDAEFAYAFYMTGNNTTLSSGYSIGFQVIISVVSEKLSYSAGGFSGRISDPYADYGVQHFIELNYTANFSGKNPFLPNGQAISPNGRIALFTFLLGGTPITMHSTYNISFSITPELIIGPYTFSGEPHEVASIQKIRS